MIIDECPAFTFNHLEKMIVPLAHELDKGIRLTLQISWCRISVWKNGFRSNWRKSEELPQILRFITLEKQSRRAQNKLSERHYS
jgi:hypothetical protein